LSVSSDLAQFESAQRSYNGLYAVSEEGAVRHLLAATETYHGADTFASNVADDGGDAVDVPSIRVTAWGGERRLRGMYGPSHWLMRRRVELRAFDIKDANDEATSSPKVTIDLVFIFQHEK
jgi:hypothetical protein